MSIDRVSPSDEPVLTGDWTASLAPSDLVLHDASGKSAVIEWRNGEMTVFDNPIGIACNSPHLDWHLTNLQNYINLSDRNPAAITIDGVKLGAIGRGRA